MTERKSLDDAATPLNANATGALPGIDLNEAREALRLAQTALVALGYKVGEHGDPVGAVDGVWDERTREAVVNFQSDRDLPRSGQLDETTTEALLDTQADAMDIASTEVGDEDESREQAQQLLHSEDRESIDDVLDGIEPTDCEAELLQ